MALSTSCRSAPVLTSNEFCCAIPPPICPAAPVFYDLSEIHWVAPRMQDVRLRLRFRLRLRAVLARDLLRVAAHDASLSALSGELRGPACRAAVRRARHIPARGA